MCGVFFSSLSCSLTLFGVVRILLLFIFINIIFFWFTCNMNDFTAIKKNNEHIKTFIEKEMERLFIAKCIASHRFLFITPFKISYITEQTLDRDEKWRKNNNNSRQNELFGLFSPSQIFSLSFVLLVNLQWPIKKQYKKKGNKMKWPFIGSF